MAFTRKNVWGSGGDFTDPAILWYARGVADMKARALTDPTGWRFYGAIHGLDTGLWTQYGYLSSADVQPSAAVAKRYWKQCQHATWYFLPWHRGYLLTFEEIVRAAIVKRGGPSDWALPYWNYFNPGQADLPAAFASNTWPDGGTNPLFVDQRYGPNGDGNVSVLTGAGGATLESMADTVFTGTFSGGTPGFGGRNTGFNHSRGLHGGVESQPHDMVHVLIGGAKDGNRNLPGLMSVPDTAALDPIFWLHHANIDRLWEIWRNNPSTNVNPTDQKWLKGPVSVGDPGFSTPKADGTPFDYTPADMVDLAKLGYTYDDLSSTAAVPTLSARLLRLGVTAAQAKVVEEKRAVAPPGETHLLGANPGALNIVGKSVKTALTLDVPTRKALTLSLQKEAVEAAPPGRVFLNLENITGVSDATVLRVYVGLRDDQDATNHPELLAGSIALFGIKGASAPDGDHAGQGLSYVLDITNIVDELHLGDALNVDQLDVQIVPTTPVPEESNIRIGRISIYRQAP